MGSERPDLGSGRPNLGFERPDLRSARSDLGSERPDMGSERPNLGLYRLDFRPEKPGLYRRGTDRWKPEKIALCGIKGHRPLRGRWPKGRCTAEQQGKFSQVRSSFHPLHPSVSPSISPSKPEAHNKTTLRPNKLRIMPSQT